MADDEVAVTRSRAARLHEHLVVAEDSMSTELVNQAVQYSAHCATRAAFERLLAPRTAARAAYRAVL